MITTKIYIRKPRVFNYFFFSLFPPCLVPFSPPGATNVPQPTTPLFKKQIYKPNAQNEI
jgi:hypothetical protein